MSKYVIVNTETNTLISEDVFMEELDSTSNSTGSHTWEKCNMDMLINLISLGNTPMSKIIIHILNTKNKDNEFTGVYKDMEKSMGLSRSTLARAFKELLDRNLIKKLTPGRYLLNPGVSSYGSQFKMMLLIDTWGRE